MSHGTILKSGTSAFIALLMGATTIATPIAPASAQLFPSPTNTAPRTRTTIAAGTLIPIRYEQAQTLQVTKGEYMPLTLTVAANFRDRNGNLLIPAGSEIVGQIEPADEGVRFVARELIVNGGRQYLPLNATSNVIAANESINEGASIANILTGTFAGAGTATIIAGTTGDRKIDALEVLAGAAIGTLAGWGLPEAGIVGGGTREVVNINPNRDLTLTLRSDLALPSASVANRSNTTRSYSLGHIN